MLLIPSPTCWSYKHAQIVVPGVIFRTSCILDKHCTSQDTSPTLSNIVLRVFASHDFMSGYWLHTSILLECWRIALDSALFIYSFGCIAD